MPVVLVPLVVLRLFPDKIIRSAVSGHGCSKDPWPFCFNSWSSKGRRNNGRERGRV